MKRKRKDADEDATYPAKKTRNPRGAAAVLARVTTSEAPSLPEVATPAPDSAVETQEEKKPERRSTRSRGSLLRRDSSASEATTVSNTANGTAAGKTKSIGATAPSPEGNKLQNGGGGAEGAKGKSEAHDKDVTENTKH
jgi:hypothetical protein